MKKKVIAGFFVFIVFCGLGFASDTPRQAARARFESFFNRIPVKMRPQYGFDCQEDFDALSLGRPFPLYEASPQSLTRWQKGDSLDNAIWPTRLLYFPVMRNKKILSFLIVDQMDGEWRAVSLGYSFLAKEMNRVLASWPDIRLIHSFQAGRFLFSVPDAPLANLTPLNCRPRKGESLPLAKTANYSQLMPLASSIQHLLDEIKE